MDPDPHHFGNLDPHPHQNKNPHPYSHRSDKLDPEPDPNPRMCIVYIVQPLKIENYVTFSCSKSEKLLGWEETVTQQWEWPSTKDPWKCQKYHINLPLFDFFSRSSLRFKSKQWSGFCCGFWIRCSFDPGIRDGKKIWDLGWMFQIIICVKNTFKLLEADTESFGPWVGMQ